MTYNRLDVTYALRLMGLALSIVLLADSALAQTPDRGIPTWLRGSWEGIPEWQEPVRTLEIDGETEAAMEAEVVEKARYGRAPGELRTVRIAVKRGSDPRVPFGSWYGGRPAIVLEGTSQDWLDGLVLTGVGPRRLEGYYFGVPPGGKTFVRFWKIGAKDATLDPKTTGLLGSWEGKWSRCTSERLDVLYVDQYVASVRYQWEPWRYPGQTKPEPGGWAWVHASIVRGSILTWERKDLSKIWEYALTPDRNYLEGLLGYHGFAFGSCGTNLLNRVK